MDKTNLAAKLSWIFHGIFRFLWLAMLPGIFLVSIFLDWKGLMFFGILLFFIAVLFYKPFCAWCSFLYERLTGWIQEHSMAAIFLSLIAVQIVLQLLCGYELAVTPSGDRNIIFKQASEIAMSGDWHTSEKYNFYFLRYPNNVTLLLIEAGYFTLLKSLGVTNFLYGNMLLNVLCIDIAIALCVLLVYCKYGKKTAVGFQMLCLFFIPFYTYIPFVYTDTLILPFVAGILLCYELAEERWEEKGRKLYGILAVLGVLTFAGFQLKPTAAILSIACILHMLIAKRGRRAVMGTALILLAFIVCSVTWKQSSERFDIVDQTDYDTENFPYTHWVMMGLQGVGYYRLEDRQYTSSFETKADKQQANLDMIRKRLKDYGAAGLMGHQYAKTVATWYSGRYDMDYYLQRQPVRNSWMHQLFFWGGKYYFLYSTYCTLYHFFLLGMVSLSILQGFRQRRLDSAVMWKAAVFGLMLFLSFWETRSRYVMHFTPVLLMIAMDTVVRNKEAVKRFVYAHRPVHVGQMEGRVI